MESRTEANTLSPAQVKTKAPTSPRVVSQPMKEHKRNKLYIYFVLRIHNELIWPKNADPLTLRSQSRLDEICKTIVRENYINQNLLPEHAYSMKFQYQYYLAKFYNFARIESQEEYNDVLEKVRQRTKDTDYVPSEYFNLEVEVELRIIQHKQSCEEIN